MAAWRVIFTDSESETGVAPVCDQQDDVSGPHRILHRDDAQADVTGVYDCCPYPHLELWGEADAIRVAQELTMIDAKLCD